LKEKCFCHKQCYYLAGDAADDGNPES